MTLRQDRLTKKRFSKKGAGRVSESAGVYIFWAKDFKPVYIGKANNLKRRVSSYFSANLSKKTSQMLKEAVYLSTVKVNSELEALLLEARLVKKMQPKYNLSLKDDKHPLYIRITKEEYPQVLTARKKDEKGKNLAFLGPFPLSDNVRSVLKMLRRIFPYAQHKLGKRGCIYSQMGLCNPCPNEIAGIVSEKEKGSQRAIYRQNIAYIKAVLSGKFTFVRKSLERMMRQYAKKEDFEMAAIVRNQIQKLDYITQPITPIGQFLENPNLLEDLRNEEIRQLRRLISKYLKVPKSLTRIECFDVAHLAGSNPTASMVTLVNGEPDKSLYRRFRIRQEKGRSDTDSLNEVAKRRAKYLSSWGIPDLIIVDGGKAQVSVFRKVFAEHKIPVVGLAKRYETLVIPVERLDLTTHGFIERKVAKGPTRNLVQRIRDEAHRFARRYHHKLLKKELLSSNS